MTDSRTSNTKAYTRSEKVQIAMIMAAIGGSLLGCFIWLAQTGGWYPLAFWFAFALVCLSASGDAGENV